jgi:hypothetical protein
VEVQPSGMGFEPNGFEPSGPEGQQQLQLQTVLETRWKLARRASKSPQELKPRLFLTPEDLAVAHAYAEKGKDYLMERQGVGGPKLGQLAHEFSGGTISADINSKVLLRWYGRIKVKTWTGAYYAGCLGPRGIFREPEMMMVNLFDIVEGIACHVEPPGGDDYYRFGPDLGDPGPQLHGGHRLGPLPSTTREFLERHVAILNDKLYIQIMTYAARGNDSVANSLKETHPEVQNARRLIVERLRRCADRGTTEGVYPYPTKGSRR